MLPQSLKYLVIRGDKVFVLTSDFNLASEIAMNWKGSVVKPNLRVVKS